NNQKDVKDCVMAWMTHLQTRKRTIHPQSFGWSNNNFVFGDYSYTPDGPELVYRGSSIDPKYDRVGELEPWPNAMELVYGSPQLEAVVASAFASPLVALMCDYSLVLSLQSHQSGFGKSTAMKLAQSVWGHPITGMSALDDTINAVMKRLKDLKNLPIYWDELKTHDQIDRVVQIVFAATQGKSKARLTREIQTAEIGSFKTMFV